MIQFKITPFKKIIELTDSIDLKKSSELEYEINSSAPFLYCVTSEEGLSSSFNFVNSDGNNMKNKLDLKDQSARYLIIKTVDGSDTCDASLNIREIIKETKKEVAMKKIKKYCTIYNIVIFILFLLFVYYIISYLLSGEKKVIDMAPEISYVSDINPIETNKLSFNFQN